MVLRRRIFCLLVYWVFSSFSRKFVSKILSGTVVDVPAGLASMFPLKFIASGRYLWLGRLVGVIFLVISVGWLIGLLGAVE